MTQDNTFANAGRTPYCHPHCLSADSDIRTSLTVINSVMDMMLETDLNIQQRELMEMGKAAVKDLVSRLDKLAGRAGDDIDNIPTDEDDSAPDDAPTAGDQPPRRMKLLLAEDNEMNQRLVVSILRNRGHDVVVANNGKEALEAAQREPFDLILMDIQMPVMDGLEATRQIRAIEASTGARKTPIVAVTAHVLNEEKERCQAIGMDGFVGKPIRRDEFLSTAESFCKAPLEETAAKAADSRDTTKNETPVLNRDAFMSIVGSNMELVRELIDLYWQSLPKQMVSLRDALDAGDATQCRYWGHAIKGMSLNLSAIQVADIAYEMEMMGKNEDLTGAEDAWERLTASVERLQKATDTILNEMPE